MRTLKQVAINMADAFTRFGLWKGGGSGGSSQVVYGGIDTNNVIYELTSTVDGAEWVATEDCYFIGELVAYNGTSDFFIDGVSVAVNYDESVSSIYFPIFILKGQTVKYKAMSNNFIRTGKFYSVKKSENILHEYSTEEKVVGKWIDGKPIYEKVININSFIMNSNSWQILPNFPTNVKQVININALLTSEGICWNISAQYDGNAIQFSNTTIELNQYIVQYTKTID